MAKAFQRTTEVANKFQFVARKNLSSGIVGRVDDDGFGARAERGGQLPFVEGPVGGLQLYEARRSTGKNRVRSVVFVERLEDDDFIAGIDDGHHGGHHGFGGAAGDGDFAFGIVADALRARKFFDDGVAQWLRSPGDGVLIVCRRRWPGARLA